MEKTKDQDLFKSWAIVELMGHRRLAGLVSEEARFGTTLLRIDIPRDPADGGQEFVTQFYGGGSIYCLTPTTEETARMVARGCQPAPVYEYEMCGGRQLPYKAPLPRRMITNERMGESNGRRKADNRPHLHRWPGAAAESFKPAGQNGWL